jgi:D-alanyl-lipoteichoic acid acyltransferase DltB (MBOAT superfamily)
MLFNSVDFLFFLPLAFLLFRLTRGTARQVVLLLSSCVFYMWFVPAYVLVLFVTIGIDYAAGLLIERSRTRRARKTHLILALVNTCLVLFVFKYHDFFVDSLAAAGLRSFDRWEILLPIGLSFHTFQSLSYVIEVYRGNIRAERNLLTYSNFVMMFPQLVAGPIERANHLLPQLRALDRPADPNDFVAGLGRFAWGLFKKVAVADVLAVYVDAVYGSPDGRPGSMLLMATVFFAVQIYCDFSGYSDMAIGVARMFGIRFRENFLLPYFSASVTEFWRRWHVSLSTWWRDYVYIPLGGGRGGAWRTCRNLLLTMLIAGLWHGASWNFVIWGGLNAVYLIFERATGLARKSPFGFAGRAAGAAYVFALVSLSWVFFRAETPGQAFAILHAIFVDFDAGGFRMLNTSLFASATAGLTVLLAFEFGMLRARGFDALHDPARGRGAAWAAGGLTLFFLGYSVLFGNSLGGQFIYFQF